MEMKMKILDINREYYPNQSERANGNTFRRIMESFLQASSGNHVYFIVNNESMVNYTAHTMFDSLRGYFGDRFERGSDMEIVEFPNGGFIRIVSKYRWERNPTPTDVKASYTIIEMDDCYVK